MMKPHASPSRHVRCEPQALVQAVLAQTGVAKRAGWKFWGGAILAAAALQLAPGESGICHAQQQSGGGRSSGGSASTGRSTAPSANSASAFGGNTLAGSGLSSGGGQSAAGTGFGSTPLTGIGAGMSSFGQQSGTGGFVGQNFGTGGFVGQANAGQTGQGANQRGGNNGGGGVNRAVQQQLNGGGNGGQNFGGAGGGGAAQQITIRPQQRIAFDFPKPVADRIEVNTRMRFDKISLKRPQLTGIDIAVNDAGEAVLTGKVSSENHRKLAEQLVRLEPGVRSITNNLETVSP